MASLEGEASRGEWLRPINRAVHGRSFVGGGKGGWGRRKSCD